MKTTDSPDQLTLFAQADDRPLLFDHVAPDFLLEIRRPALMAKLRQVQEAAEFPWENLTVAMTEEMWFNAQARLFPRAEGETLLVEFAEAIRRVYALIDEPWEPLYYGALLKTCRVD